MMGWEDVLEEWDVNLVLVGVDSWKGRGGGV